MTLLSFFCPVLSAQGFSFILTKTKLCTSMACLPTLAGRRLDKDKMSLLEILARAQDTHHVVLAEFKPDSVPALAPLLYHARESRVNITSRLVNGAHTPDSREIINLIEAHQWVSARRQVIFYLNGNFTEAHAHELAGILCSHLLSAYVYEPIHPTC